MNGLTWAAFGLSLLALHICTVFSAPAPAPVKNASNTSGFMELMYANLSSRNLSKWIFPPKEDVINKSALFQQVNKLCQSRPELASEPETPIHYACASMLETVIRIWSLPNIETIVSENKSKIELPSKLDDLYKENDLQNVSNFCHTFSRILNPKDFDSNLSAFVNNFILNASDKSEKNDDKCEFVCKNVDNGSVISPGEVNPVCAIWRKGYSIYKIATAGENENASPVIAKPKVENDDQSENNAGEVGQSDRGTVVDTSTKKRKELFAETDEPVNLGGKKQPLPAPAIPVVASHTEGEKDPVVDFIKKHAKGVSESPPAKLPENGTEQKKDNPQNLVSKNDEKIPSGKPNGPSSSSTQSSAAIMSEGRGDVPIPPVGPSLNEKSSSPKSVDNSKDQSSPSVSVNKKPAASKPTDGSIVKVEQQNQNEAPGEADYDDGDMPPPALSEKAKTYDGDDDSVIDTAGADQNQNQNRPKPVSNVNKGQSPDTLSVSVSKEKHIGDNVEVDKVSIESDAATVNVAFNEQSDPGVINYFVCFLGILAILYLLFHNKKRLIAFVVEGRRPASGRRRSSSTQYRKLENNYD